MSHVVAGTLKHRCATSPPRHRGTQLVRAAVARITTPCCPTTTCIPNPLWSARELRARVVSVRRETADTATIEIKPGWGFSFDYQPGQYLGIGVAVGGRWIWRSTPHFGPEIAERDQTVSITVKGNAGAFSSHLVTGIEPGTIVLSPRPAGEFVRPAAAQTPVSSPPVAASRRSCRCGPSPIAGNTPTSS